jgi:hypothetical protein
MPSLLHRYAFCHTSCGLGCISTRSQVHYFRHAGDAAGPLLLLLPESATTLSELAGQTRVAAAAVRPRGYAPPPHPPALALPTLASSFGLPLGAALPSEVALTADTSSPSGASTPSLMDESSLQAYVQAAFTVSKVDTCSLAARNNLSKTMCAAITYESNF